MTTIKKMELEKEGKNVKVTLEKAGVDYVFYARSVDMMDEKKRDSLLKFWNEKAIPEKEVEAGLSGEALNASFEKMKGKVIE